MILAPTNFIRSSCERKAFSIIEVMISSVIVGILFITLYTSLATGYGLMQAAREDLRATQIMLEKIETLRLYNWDQLNTPGFVPASFEATYNPLAGTNTTNAGVTYSGSIEINAPAMTNSYSADVREIVVKLSWQDGSVLRNRTMNSLSAKYGIQNYIYSQ